MLAAPVGADSIQVTGGSWYWAGQVSAVNPGNGVPPVAPPAALPTPDVPSGDFPVAVKAGQVDKESFLHLDSTAIPQGATVTSLKLILKEDTAAQQQNAAAAKLQAMPVTQFFSDGGSAAPIAQAPSYDPNGPAGPGTRAPDGTWTFDITPIAQKWADGSLANNGVALVPAAPTITDTYEVVWSGTNPVPTTEGSVTPGTAAGGSSSGGGATTDTGASPVAITPDTSAPLVTPPADTSTPAISATPITPAITAPPTTAVAAPRARRIVKASRPGLTAPFFLVGLAALGFIALAALALGDLGEPTPERRGSVLRALERHVPTRELGSTP